MSGGAPGYAEAKVCPLRAKGSARNDYAWLAVLKLSLARLKEQPFPELRKQGSGVSPGSQPSTSTYILSIRNSAEQSRAYLATGVGVVVLLGQLWLATQASHLQTLV